MNDQLIDILKQTDAAHSPTTSEPTVPTLADAAIAESDRRVRRRRAVGLSGAMLMVAALFLLIPWQGSEPSDSHDSIATQAPRDVEAKRIDVAAVRAELRDLDRRAAMMQAVLDRVQESKRARAVATRANTHRGYSRALDARIEVESAAQTMLLQGDWFAGDKLTHRLAHDTYKRILELFPDSAAAQTARKRLDGAPKGENA